MKKFMYVVSAMLVLSSVCVVSCRDDEEDRYSPPTKNTSSNTSSSSSNSSSGTKTNTPKEETTPPKTEEKQTTPLTGRAMNGDVINMVDLGLPSGTKWADRNIGALTPANDGQYFAWGELYTKSEYTRDTYEFYTYRIGYSNIGSSIAGTKYDAATFNWGEGYTIPTYSQISELMNTSYTTWTKTSQRNTNGKDRKGYIVRSKKNGKSIFLPFAGEIDEHGKRNEDSYGFYWSSTLESFDNSSKEYAWLLYMDGGYGKIQTWNIMTVNGPVHGSSREDGLSIRPVCK